MDKRSNGPARTLVIPGEVLGEGNLKAGKCTFKRGDKIYAAQMGFKSVSSNFVNVIPLSGRYIPKPDDLIIGVIQSVSPSTWLVDINSPYPAPLHVNEVPWRVDFGDTARYLITGNTILARVFIVDEVKRIQVTMKDQGSRKLSGGQIIEISPTKVPRIIGKGGSMISMIKQKTQCRVFVGQNGRIWIDGEPESIRIAMNAIQFIQDESHRFGLTEAVERYLDEAIGGTADGEKEHSAPEIVSPAEASATPPGPVEAPARKPSADRAIRPEPTPVTTAPAPPVPPATNPAPVPKVGDSATRAEPTRMSRPVRQPMPSDMVRPVPRPPQAGHDTVPNPGDSTFRPPQGRTDAPAQAQVTVEPRKKAGEQILKNEEFERMSD